MQKIATVSEIFGSKRPATPAILTRPFTGRRCPKKERFGKTNVPITIMLEAGLADKIDKLKIKRGTNRSGTIRHILHKNFKSGTTFTDLIDELECIKSGLTCL